MSNPKRPEVFNHLVLGDSPVRIGADAEVEASLLPSRPAGRQHCGPDGSDKAAPVNHCAPSRSHAKKLRTHGHADHLPHCTKSYGVIRSPSLVILSEAKNLSSFRSG